MIRRFFRSANSTSCSACAAVEVNGFSTKTCLPFFSADSAKFEMGPDRRDNRDGVNVGRGENGIEIAGDLDVGKVPTGPLQRCRVLVTYGDDSAAVRAVEVSGDTRSPVPVTDNG